MKEYKQLIYKNDQEGQAAMASDINMYARQGWKVLSIVAADAGLDGAKTAAIGITAAVVIDPTLGLLGPLLGKRQPDLIVTLEREVAEDSLSEVKQSEERPRFCTACGSSLLEDAAFCTRCGKTIA
jgi:hypothetical protein